MAPAPAASAHIRNVKKVYITNANTGRKKQFGTCEKEIPNHGNKESSDHNNPDIAAPMPHIQGTTQPQPNITNI